MSWPRLEIAIADRSVQLRDVLRPVDRSEPIDPAKSYRQLGVRLWGEGAYERARLDGALTHYGKLSRVDSGDVVVNKIWARNGSVAVVPQELAGCYVSGEFPTFEPDRSRVDPHWLSLLMRMSPFWQQCDEQSRGTSGKNRIRPDRFLGIRIPLPPLSDQKRVVDAVNRVDTAISTIMRLRSAAATELAVMIDRQTDVALAKLVGPYVQLGQLLSEPTLNGLSKKPNDAPPGVPILRISSVTSRQDYLVDSSDFKYIAEELPGVERYLLTRGDLLACRFNGNLAFVGRFALYASTSDEPRVFPDKLIRFRVDRARVSPEYVCLALASSRSRAAIQALCGTTAGNIGISAAGLRTIEIPIPTLQVQAQVVAAVASFRQRALSVAVLQELTTNEVGQIPSAVRNLMIRWPPNVGSVDDSVEEVS